jgi:hypothetical protein
MVHLMLVKASSTGNETVVQLRMKLAGLLRRGPAMITIDCGSNRLAVMFVTYELKLGPLDTGRQSPTTSMRCARWAVPGLNANYGLQWSASRNCGFISFPIVDAGSVPSRDLHAMNPNLPANVIVGVDIEYQHVHPDVRTPRRVSSRQLVEGSGLYSIWPTTPHLGF